MNFLMFVVALALPLAISASSLREMEFYLTIDNFASNASSSLIRTKDDGFLTKVISCAGKVIKTPEFLQCGKDEAAKVHGAYSKDDPKTQCCVRVIMYECMKKFLVSNCDVTQQEVDNHDDEHFKFWNDFSIPKVPLHCTGNRTESLAYCNGFSKMTFSFTLQSAIILTLILHVFY